MKTPGAVLLVDDEEAFRANIAERLRSRGFEVHEAPDGARALEVLREHVIEVALVDVLMPGMTGLELLPKVKEIDPWLQVVIATGQASIESAVEAMKKGAYHYVTKPIRLAELDLILGRALERSRLLRQNTLYREQQRRARGGSPVELVAASPAMKALVEQAERFALADAPVLIEGETGTGKEVLAEHIHRKSARSEQPMVVLNCAALSETLLDAELFGHEKGAYTGAETARPGLVEIADGGTLLLDEIGDMNPAGQVRLLRFLERGVFRRVGSSREQSVDVRVLAATHRDLSRAMAEGRFREDLYHRLHVFSLKLPPLRERAEDIPALVDSVLARLSARAGRVALAEGAISALRSYPWPGNIRELVHTLERAHLLASTDGTGIIQPGHLGLAPMESATDVRMSLDQAQARHVQAVLRSVGGNRQRAAEVLGVSERHLYRLIQNPGASASPGV